METKKKESKERKREGLSSKSKEAHTSAKVKEANDLTRPTENSRLALSARTSVVLFHLPILMQYSYSDSMIRTGMDSLRGETSWSY